MIRLAIIGTRSAGKSSVARALAIPDARIVEDEARAADAYLLVCDKDLTDADFEQLTRIARSNRPVGVALNKADTYSRPQRRVLWQHIRRRLDRIVPPERIVWCAADPVRIVLHQRRDGSVVERVEALPPDVSAVVALANELVAEAASSLRVRARLFAAQWWPPVRGL